MAKCPHCGKELDFTVIPRKPKIVKAAKAAPVKAAAKKTGGTKPNVAKSASGPKAPRAAKAVPAPKAAIANPAVKKAPGPKNEGAPKRPLLKNPDFLNPTS